MSDLPYKTKTLLVFEGFPCPIDFLNRITPSNMSSFVREQHKCNALSFLAFITHSMVVDNVGDDCPVFDDKGR